MTAAAAAARAARRHFSSRLQTTTSRLLHANRFLIFSSPLCPIGDSQAAARETSGSFIHPAAVVHPDAAIGQVQCYREMKILMKMLTIESKQGRGSVNKHLTFYVTRGGAIVGADIPGRTIIGENNVIGHYAVVGAKCQDLKYKTGDECFLHIGRNNEIREYCSVHRSSKSCDCTVIGDNNLIMGSSHIAHDCKIGNNNIFANNTLFAGHVIVEDWTHTAGAVVVHQFCHIGSYSFLGGGSVVAQDVPRYMMVAGDRAELRGLNIEGLRRNGFSDQEVRRLRKAYQRVFMPTITSKSSFEDRLAELEQEVELSESPAVSCMVESIRMSFVQGHRGICKFRSWNSS
ncbi:hypothetical protein Zm00014a_026002 [Zea mays]|uniref:UDP N-acetylglucosamine O-acyltransferase C-terminal domain-containing protein n=2 Tax=Zea mays TaxID=4577 RepID=A0A3L6DLC4_MAIZE|nr:putative acyl-[acyl-carrier-protein]--UDP-N-acetylglucosamine O-acyltransferase, mitochondrial [Zea mays]PWZ09447.1 hypothetical protein Zm00014a_026002 [Zea mays]PWZ09448.1 hypothetical protein Zm00014a_026002 [Zea mays]